jgi:hypothetical protein
MAKLYQILNNMRGGTSKNLTSLNIAALEWLHGKYIELTQRKITISQALKEGKVSKDILEGHMYMYAYDPKTKTKLPYYDAFPLVIPIERYSPTKFLGINFHYLPYSLRNQLLSNMMENIQHRPGHGAYVDIHYPGIVKSIKYKSAFPCLHRYDLKQIRSNIIKIDEEGWLQSINLPIERFKKANLKAVWNDSEDHIRRRKS